MLNIRLITLGALLALAACQSSPEVPPLAGARIGGPFALVDQDAHARTDRDFAGKYRIMYFGYTFCPDVCPVDVANLMAGWRAFAKSDPARAARVVPVFVTVDPARDTSPVLKTWTQAIDSHLVGLTGTAAQVAQAANAYGVSYTSQQKGREGGYLVDHSRAAFLMDPDGKPIALLSHDGTPATIAAELDRWVK